MRASDIDESIGLSVMMVNAIHHLLVVIFVQLQRSSLRNFFHLLKYARKTSFIFLQCLLSYESSP